MVSLKFFLLLGFIMDFSYSLFDLKLNSFYAFHYFYFNTKIYTILTFGALCF